ncbi:hypothetical protein BJX68DRAFT_191096 [Aspergillus pseudodeflectus]|uniref:Uncharacterized protein n=1 Tax=Aspergillus pseudodeflectus TaxID=176178 RepID=A0ABR4KWQ4_9EURO
MYEIGRRDQLGSPWQGTNLVSSHCSWWPPAPLLRGIRRRSLEILYAALLASGLVYITFRVMRMGFNRQVGGLNDGLGYKACRDDLYVESVERRPGFDGHLYFRVSLSGLSSWARWNVSGTCPYVPEMCLQPPPQLRFFDAL